MLLEPCHSAFHPDAKAVASKPGRQEPQTAKERQQKRTNAAEARKAVREAAEAAAEFLTCPKCKLHRTTRHVKCREGEKHFRERHEKHVAKCDGKPPTIKGGAQCAKCGRIFPTRVRRDEHEKTRQTPPPGAAAAPKPKPSPEKRRQEGAAAAAKAPQEAPPKRRKQAAKPGGKERKQEKEPDAEGRDPPPKRRRPPAGGR
eukprot:gene13749-18025_t